MRTAGPAKHGKEPAPGRSDAKRSAPPSFAAGPTRRALLALPLAILAAPAIAQTRRRRPIEGDMRIGLMLTGIADDHGRGAGHVAAMRAAIASIGGRASLNVMERVGGHLDAERVATRLAREGHHLVVATNALHEAGVLEAARRYPNVLFELAGMGAAADNVSTFDVRAHEARFVEGAIAARVGRRGPIGFVGTTRVPEVHRAVNAFVAGARSVRADASVHVAWAGAWFDPWAEAEAARRLIARGCEVLAHHTDTPAPLQVAEQRGLRGFGHGADMGRFAPNAQMTAAIHDWSVHYSRRVMVALNGTWEPSATIGGLVDGMLALAPYANMPPQALAAARAAEAAVRADPTLPFRGPIRDTLGQERVAAGATLDEAALATMDWFAAGVLDNTLEAPRA